MPRIAWLTDLHLVTCGSFQRDAFLAGLGALSVDRVVITGDISNARHLRDDLLEIADAVDAPVDFVLGNHDFYHGSITAVRAQATALAEARRDLTYLSVPGTLVRGDGFVLVGNDGWGDARFGNWAESSVILNDFRLIQELAGLTRRDLIARLRSLGDEAAAHLRGVLSEIPEACPAVVIATHVPPFEGAAWHKGQTSDAEHIPYFACQATGEVILDAARLRPEIRFLVLCGHTHSEGQYVPEDAPNVQVLTGAATYGAPRVQRVIDL